MYIKYIGIILVGVLFCVSTAYTTTTQEQIQQQTQQAQATLRAVAKQLGNYYAQHNHYPSATIFGANFEALGMREPPSKVWDYFFQCKAYTCDAYAEHKRKYYSADDSEGITPILRLTVHKTKPGSLIHVEARSIWFIQRNNTTIMMEQVYAAPREVCQFFGGRKDKESGCILYRQ